MIHIPEDLQLRSERDPHYVNIDVAGKEIGHLVINDDGQVTRSWAVHIENRRLMALVSCVFSAANSLKRPPSHGPSCGGPAGAL